MLQKTQFLPPPISSLQKSPLSLQKEPCTSAKDLSSARHNFFCKTQFLLQDAWVFCISKCMYVHTYIYIYICMCVCIHMYICVYTYIFVYKNINMYLCICIYIHEDKYIRTNIQQRNICLYIYMYICTQICIYICIYIHMYLYISIRICIYTLYVYISISSILPTWSWCPGTRSFSYHLGVVFSYLRRFHLCLTVISDLSGMCSVKVFASNCHGIILPRYGSTMFRKIWSCL